MTVGSILVAILLGLIVFAVGTFFDKTADNRYAGMAGLIVFVVVLLGGTSALD